jgi:hypothetical protein
MMTMDLGSVVSDRDTLPSKLLNSFMRRKGLSPFEKGSILQLHAGML